MAHSLAWTLAFALPIFMLSAISIYINLRTRLRCVFSCLDDKSKLLVIGKRELLAFSERKRTRTLILNLLLSLIWAVACAVTLFQVRQMCSARCAICLCASQGALVLTRCRPSVRTSPCRYSFRRLAAVSRSLQAGTQSTRCSSHSDPARSEHWADLCRINLYC